MRMRIMRNRICAKSGQQWDEKIHKQDDDYFPDWVRELEVLKTMLLMRRNSANDTKKMTYPFSQVPLWNQCV